MPDPLLLPSIAMLSGGGLLAARDYLRRRLEGTEDRYMALYGKAEWEASNMDLAIHAPVEHYDDLKAEFLHRLDKKLRDPNSAKSMLREEADLGGYRLDFYENPAVKTQDLLRPRHGIYFDLDHPGRIRVVWNHMQTDGVGMWTALRDLFDPNPPLIPYREVPPPPPFLPELLALPSTARRLVWRGRLRQNMPDVPLTRGLTTWDTRPLRTLKRQVRGSFNLLVSAVVVSQVFRRHPDRARLNVGLTAYFPFLKGRNKYGVFLCNVKRGEVASIFEQLKKQTQNEIRNWGIAAAQSYALGRMPDSAFAKLVSYYRRQIDVLISSLPVGRKPVAIGNIPTVLSCHPWELTLPYYFLLIGTRTYLDVSFTSRFNQDERFLDLTPDLEVCAN